MALRYLPPVSSLSRRKGLMQLQLFIMAIGLNLTTPAYPQIQEGCFPVWQGFRLAWHYPHSIARLGSRVIPFIDSLHTSECNWQSLNNAISGNGADEPFFRDYYSTVKTALIQSRSGSITMGLSGKEGETISVTELGEADFQSLNEPGTNWEVILDGFDLRTTADAQADQLQSLDMAIDSVWLDLTAKKVRFRANVAARLACPTLDCEPLNQVVDYELELFWRVIGGPGFQSTRSSYGGSRSWEKTDTDSEAMSNRLALLGDAHYDKATVAITGLHLQLDRPALMIVWDSHFECSLFKKGLLNLYLWMDYRQASKQMYFYRHGMRKFKPHPTARWNIKPHAGTLVWEMDVSLLQFEEATIVPHITQNTE